MINFYFTLVAGFVLCTTLCRGASLSESKFSYVLTSQPRIVGGRPALPSEVPYILSLHLNGMFKCGASLLWDPAGQMQFAITAAHCVQRFSNTCGLTLTAGSLSKTNAGVNTTGQILAVKRIIMHPNYETTLPGIPVNDIAVILMSGSFQENENVMPITLPTTATINVNETDHEVLIASGWGSTESVTDPRSDILRVVDLPIMDNELCVELYESIFGNTSVVFDSNICAGEINGGKDTCHGDSGGPLATRGRCPVLIGITSWGEGCARPNFPGVYTRVSEYREWILASLSQKKD